MARFSDEDLALMENLLEKREFKPGEMMIRAGEDAQELYLLIRGLATVVLPRAKGQIRLDVFAPGMTFGELAFLDGSKRAADVLASSEVTCLVLSRDKFSELETTAPLVKIQLLENITRILAASLRRVNTQLESSLS